MNTGIRQWVKTIVSRPFLLLAGLAMIASGCNLLNPGDLPEPKTQEQYPEYQFGKKELLLLADVNSALVFFNTAADSVALDGNLSIPQGQVGKVHIAKTDTTDENTLGGEGYVVAQLFSNVVRNNGDEKWGDYAVTINGKKYILTGGIPGDPLAAAIYTSDFDRAAVYRAVYSDGSPVPGDVFEIENGTVSALKLRAGIENAEIAYFRLGK